MAAEYIPQQIGLLNAAKIRKARKGLWAGLGAIPSGYIVDYCKGNPTFEKLIPYLPHKQIIVSLYERLYALCGNFQQFCRELDEMAFLFPPFESWVEQRIVAQCRRRKVPGGTHLSRRGLISLLTNPVYLGWWIVQGDIISRENHEPIIDKDHEYLFWYAFNLLSDYTVDGDANEQCQKRPPRRFSHKTTEEQPALLKDRIATPNGKAYAHITRSTCSYVLYPAYSQVMVKPDAEVEAKIIDAVFKTRFFERLEATHDFDVYQRWIAEETQKQESIYETICAQLSQIAVREQVIMKEIIAIQTKIIADTKTEEERKQLEQEAEPIIEGWRNQLMMLVKPKKELAAKKQMLEKDEQLVTARKFSDFQTELRKLIPVWEKKPIAIRREFVNLFVEQAVLRIVAPHFVQLDIFWTHPAWEADRINIYRRTGAKPYWTDEEKHILRTYYPLAPIDDLLQRLPQKTWGSIKQEAIVLGIQRNVKIPSSCSKTLTVTDVQFMIEHNIPLQDVRPNCESLSWRSSLFRTSDGSVQDSHPNCESPPRRCADEPIHPLD